MYITSELFGSDATRSRCDSPTSTPTWDTMADPQHTTGLGKRKRRMDADEGPSSTAHISFQRRSPPASRGLRLHNPSHTNPDNHHRTYTLPAGSTACFLSESRPLKQLKRVSPNKATLVKSTSHLMDMEPDATSSSGSNTHTAPDLRPCHICHSTPKRKKDLENYYECRRCKGRTCFVCARECAGGCQKLCSKCCVEVGEEGDTLCLDCYSRNVNS